MKKMIFKVSNPKDGNMSALIKEVNKIPCRLQLDIENGFVTVENVNDTKIDTVIELVNNYYTLLGVDIDNSVESVTEKSEQDETILEPEVVAKTLGPQSEDDLIIEKVEFENEYVRQLINKLLRTAYWAMFTRNISEGEIGKFIYTSIDEISMNYNGEDSIPFSIGDVVDCNYGMHLTGEINGSHVSAIACHISKAGMVYVVPITVRQENLKSHSYLTIDVPNDIISNGSFIAGTVLLDKGKYVRAERFRQVIGKTTPEFFAKILNQLSSTFDFTEAIADTTASNEKESEVPKKTLANKKVSDVETALLETIGFALDKLDSSKKVEEQLESFLADIGMTTKEEIVAQCFVIACDIKKITYGEVLFELQKKYPKIERKELKASLRENFKKWLKQNPELAEKYPKMSFMAVLKVFAKRLA